jgi:hypothetical protein
MATSETQIANMALAQLGNGTQIASLNEKSNEARACTLFYEQCRDEVLGAFPWGFAQWIAALEVVEENPTDEWGFSYRYPSDALTVWRIPSGIDRAVIHGIAWSVSVPAGLTALPVPFRIGSDDSGRLIFCDLANASAEYTKRETDVTRYDAAFTNMLALRLASDIAPLVTGGDPFKLGAVCFQKYEMKLGEARARAANEEGRDPPPDSQLITTRY